MDALGPGPLSSAPCLRLGDDDTRAGTMGCQSPAYGAYAECPKIVEFTDLFGDRGLHFDMCDDSISTALTDGLDRLEMSCDEIVVE
jgi:hypothetical protein